MEIIMLAKSTDSTTAKIVVYVFILLCGICEVMAAILNWDWYFNSRKTRMACDFFGRTAVRVINAIIGLIVVGVSVYWLINPNAR